MLRIFMMMVKVMVVVVLMMVQGVMVMVMEETSDLLLTWIRCPCFHWSEETRIQ